MHLGVQRIEIKCIRKNSVFKGKLYGQNENINP